MNRTHMGESYVLRRSLPFRLARMNVAPSAGTRYSEARKAKTESPAEAYRAGNGGAGSMSGRTRNQVAVGTRVNSKRFGSRRGRIACSCAMTEPKTVCGDEWRRGPPQEPIDGC